MLPFTRRGPANHLLDLLKPRVAAFQDFIFLSGRAFRNVFRRPHYTGDILMQMDIIGVGSLPIVILTGFFSGAVMALQMSRALATYGATGQIGQIVAITLVRELGPVLSSLLVAGRNASGMASELGSMKVTEQIDAMRALGTDPVQKLVTPRVIATCVTLPLLTIIADFVGLIGGFVVAYFMLNLTSGQYWTTAWQALEWNDLAQGLTQAVCLRHGHFASRLLLRDADQGRHARRRQGNDAGCRCRVRVDLCHYVLHHSGVCVISDMSDPILRFENVSLSFEGEPALHDVSFEVLPGHTRIIFGAAGSGKSVLLKPAIGLLKPDTGTYLSFRTGDLRARRRGAL